MLDFGGFNPPLRSLRKRAASVQMAPTNCRLCVFVFDVMAVSEHALLPVENRTARAEVHQVRDQSHGFMMHVHTAGKHVSQT